MLKAIPGVVGELVFSKDECGYQVVLDAIPDAEKVSVVTYNISRSQDGLLGALVRREGEVRLITNIPGRFENYYSDDARTGAAKAIERMFARLEPKRFGALARILFCFRNHAKIIVTDSIAYVGSANFAEESAARIWPRS